MKVNYAKSPSLGSLQRILQTLAVFDTNGEIVFNPKTLGVNRRKYPQHFKKITKSPADYPVERLIGSYYIQRLLLAIGVKNGRFSAKFGEATGYHHGLPGRPSAHLSGVFHLCNDCRISTLLWFPLHLEYHYSALYYSTETTLFHVYALLPNGAYLTTAASSLLDHLTHSCRRIKPI